MDLRCLVLLACLLPAGRGVSTAWAAGELRVAVLPFEALEVRETTADLLAEFLREELGRAQGITMVSAEGQPRGCLSVDCGVRTAAMIGADRVVLGRARLVGSEYLLELRIVDRATRAEMLSITARAETEDGLFPRADGVLGELGNVLLKPLQEETPPSATLEPLRVEHLEPSALPAGKPLSLEARITPALGSRRLVLIYENAAGARGTVACGDAGGGRFVAEVPGSMVVAGAFRYYFRILEGGREVTREPQLGFTEVPVVATADGTPPSGAEAANDALRQAATPPAAEDPAAERDSGGSKLLWWIGGIIGAAAVVAVVAL